MTMAANVQDRDLRNLNAEREGGLKNATANVANANKNDASRSSTSKRGGRKSTRKKNAGAQAPPAGGGAGGAAGLMGGMQAEIQRKMAEQKRQQAGGGDAAKTRPGQKLPLATTQPAAQPQPAARPAEPPGSPAMRLSAYTVRKHGKHAEQDRRQHLEEKRQKLERHGLAVSLPAAHHQQPAATPHAAAAPQPAAAPARYQAHSAPASPSAFSPPGRGGVNKHPELSLSRPSDMSTYAGSLPSAAGTPNAREQHIPDTASSIVSDASARSALYHNIGSNASQHVTHARRGSNRLLVLTDHAAPWPTSVTPLQSPKWRLRDFEQKADLLIGEFFLSGDYQEFTDQVRWLNCDVYADVLVARAFRQSLDLTSTFQADMAKQMILKLVLDGDVDKSAFLRGIFAHVANLADLELDVPGATEEILNMLEEIVQLGRLERDVFYRLPEPMLRRGGYTEIANQLRLFKIVAGNNVREYLSMGNYLKFEANVRDFGKGFHHFFHEVVRKLVTMSFDLPLCGANANGAQTFRWVAKTVHKLLQRNIITDEDVQHGIAMVLGGLPDLQLDVPKVNQYFAKTLSYCIAEEVVTADLVKREQRLAYGMEAGVHCALEALHSTPEYSRKVWGEDGDERTLEQEMDLAVHEYKDSWDCAEVARIMGELHLNREAEIKFIRKIIVDLCIASGPRYCDHGLYLVEYLMQAFGTQLEVEDAVEALRCDTDDLVLDYPNIEGELSGIVERMEYRGLVSKEYRRMDAQYMV